MNNVNLSPLEHKRGFTIVELLIVIVVIGILAAIIIVAYNGVQARAERAKVASIASGYQKLFGLYRAEKDSHLFTDSSMQPTGYLKCLGSGSPSDSCYTDASSGYVVNYSAGFAAALSPFGQLASTAHEARSNAWGTATGWMYQYIDSLDSGGPYLIYFPRTADIPAMPAQPPVKSSACIDGFLYVSNRGGAWYTIGGSRVTINQYCRAPLNL